ncbi:MAG TPA: hypothetical protein VER76_18685 [Pyrinomonadaceae bacterium]|nr:hypothetical protein [Pyrinomonadaceae bacterium]
MQTRRRFLPAALSLALLVALLPATSVSRASSSDAHAPAAVTTVWQAGALERGYRTGYSDGYQAGYRDSVDRATRDYRNKEEYGRADRAYVAAYGALEDYRDGYQQGFEVGYESGFDRRGFDSVIPTGLSRRGTSARNDAGAPSARDDDDATATRNSSGTTPDPRASDSDNRSGSTGGGSGRQIGSLDLPVDTNMRVELLTNLSTDATQRGDRFEARVIEPAEYEGARVFGRVKNVKRAGKVRGSAELQLDFEQISLPDGRFTNFHAQVIEVVGQSSGNVGEVDEEGGVRGQSTTKDDVTKVGAGAGIGAIIGAIAGGGKGAAIGAVIGGSIGAGGAITSRGKDIRLQRGQELIIRTSTETRIQ